MYAQHTPQDLTGLRDAGRFLKSPMLPAGCTQGLSETLGPVVSFHEKHRKIRLTSTIFSANKRSRRSIPRSLLGLVNKPEHQTFRVLTLSDAFRMQCGGESLHHGFSELYEVRHQGACFIASRRDPTRLRQLSEDSRFRCQKRSDPSESLVDDDLT